MIIISFSFYSQNIDCMTEVFENQLTSSNSSCNPNLNFSYSTDPNFLASFPEKTISVYFWAINKSDSTSVNPFKTLNLQESVDLLNGQYIINLVTDNVIEDTKTIIKN